jgi:hypothetical protein
MLILGLVLLVIGFIANVAILRDAWDHLAGRRRRLVDPGIDGTPGWRPSALLVARRRVPPVAPMTCRNDIVFVRGHLVRRRARSAGGAARSSR